MQKEQNCDIKYEGKYCLAMFNYPYGVQHLTQKYWLLHVADDGSFKIPKLNSTVD